MHLSGTVGLTRQLIGPTSLSGHPINHEWTMWLIRAKQTAADRPSEPRSMWPSPHGTCRGDNMAVTVTVAPSYRRMPCLPFNEPDQWLPAR